MKIFKGPFLILFLLSACAGHITHENNSQRSIASEIGSANCAQLLTNIIGHAAKTPTAIGEEDRKTISGLLTQIAGLDYEAVGGRTLPDVDQMDEAVALRDQFNNLRAKYDPSTLEALIDQSPELKNALLTFNTNVRTPATLPTENKKYLGGEYKLKSYYQKLFAEINTGLPLKYRIPILKIPTDLADSVLIKQAEAIMTERSFSYTKIFSTTGFAGHKEYLEFLKKNQSQIGKELIDDIEKENFDVAMAAPSSVRRGIQISGFLNQYVTNTSGGTLDHSLRIKAESALLGMSPEKYLDVRNEVKPKYAYLAPSLNSKIEGFDASLYGDDRYIFKKEKLKKRMTLAKGDSLVIGSYNINFPKAEKPVLMNQWDSSFIPWEYRSLMVPALEKQFKKGHMLNAKIDPKEFSRLKFQETINFDDVPYVETQIWGPIDLNDVEKFIFYENEPTGEFLKELQSKGVKIYDARDGKTPSLWSP